LASRISRADYLILVVSSEKEHFLSLSAEDHVEVVENVAAEDTVVHCRWL
jgi:hypothetical protein